MLENIEAEDALKRALLLDQLGDEVRILQISLEREVERQRRLGVGDEIRRSGPFGEPKLFQLCCGRADAAAEIQKGSPGGFDDGENLPAYM